ncbi:uncharacterized protein LOC129771287 [Toxorhynchites rutilus septentrionalis]|uniref:uncharacterized protein LOC129771287 n=1 Tax=Toxorhynchites rutilus septentrionalis TaxID=329112 RepID=UPI0024785DFD|nr:uncharacterized protein LOC129771287 [Toxorhynchites rutilus septentrionalis]
MANKSNKKEWMKGEIEELICLYCSKVELWDVTSVEYKDRLKKISDYKEMTEKFNTTVEAIRKKLHNLRNQFNPELKKSRTTKSLQGTDELYVSQWPYHNSLKFMQGSFDCRPAIGNIAMIAARDSWWMIIQTTGVRTHIGAVSTKHQSVAF